MFEEILDEHKDRNGYMLDTDLDAEDWDELVARYKERVDEELGKPFPQDPHEQLWGAIGAVFGSLDEPARHHLSPAAQHPGELGHRRQRPGHGVRQSWATPRPPASPSPAIRRPARSGSTASS